MSDGYLLGFDIGGGGGRCLLADATGRTLRIASRAWRPTCTPGTAGLGFDLDVEMVFEQLAEACREVLERGGVGPEAVAGIATSAMREGTVLVDEAGEVLLAAPNRDARAAGEAIELAELQGDTIYARSGRWPYPIFTAPRLLWLRNQAPERFARLRHVLSLSDWLGWRLCGQAVAEPSQAGESLLFDLRTRDWAWDLIAELGLPAEIFPSARDAGTGLGPLAPDAAAAMGLKAGVPVAVGGADSQLALLAAGVVEPGQVGAITGTTAPVQLITAEPILDPQQRLWTGHHVVPGAWVLESNAGPLGESIEWIGRILFPDSPDPVERLFAEAALSEPGAGGMLSTVGVEIWNARELGVGIGHLTLTHMLTGEDPMPRRHLARSVIEGLAFGLRANLAQVCEVAGAEPQVLRLGGGVSRNPSWVALLSDTFGLPIEASTVADTSALGAAMCAGVGAGVYEDLAEASGRLAALDERRLPDGARARAAATIYESWNSLRHERKTADTMAGAVATPWILRANDTSAAQGIAGTTATAQAFKPRILVTADMAAEPLAALARLGEVEYASFRDRMRLLTGAALVEALKGTHVFITEVDIVDAAALEQLPELRVVATCRGDAVNVGLAACTAHGIPVLHAPGRNAVGVADLTLAFMLMQARKLQPACAFLRAAGGEAGDMGRMGQAFSTFRGNELWSRTVGLVGLGAVGREVAKRLRAFGARVLVADPHVTAEHAAVLDAQLVPLSTLLEESDIVSLHAAVTDETRGMIGTGELARMKPGAVLVNTARAALVDEEALVTALESGQLGGAALDVFAIEPPGADHPLLQLDNVIATPHVAGNTREVAIHQGRIIAADLARLLRGEPPAHVLNPEALEGFDWSRPRKQPDAARLRELREQPPPAVSDLQRTNRSAAAGNDAPAARTHADGPSGSRATPVNPATGAAGSPAPVSQAGAGPQASAAPSSAGDAEVRRRMERIIEGFVAGIVADDSMRRFASEAEVTLHFHVTDLDIPFYFRLAGGEVTGAVGAPVTPAEVQLKMAADILDGMFTGRINAMQSAMDGRLSFTGDAAKAMTLQQLQGDLQRLYEAAREEAGDPGDLTAIGGADAQAPLAPGARGDRAKEVVHIVGELYAAELITATGGNVSARTEPGGGELWITPSQLFKGELSTDVLVRIDLDGQPLDAGARSPSSERLMHTAVYKAKPEAEAVIHCHAPNATILANAELPFLPISTEAAFFGNIPRVPFIMPGTTELAEAIGEAIGDGWAVLMKNHGLLVAGRSLRRAADMAEVVERSAQIMLGCYAVGTEPPVLPHDVVERLRRMGDLVA